MNVIDARKQLRELIAETRSRVLEDPDPERWFDCTFGFEMAGALAQAARLRFTPFIGWWYSTAPENSVHWPTSEPSLVRMCQSVFFDPWPQVKAIQLLRFRDPLGWSPSRNVATYVELAGRTKGVDEPQWIDARTSPAEAKAVIQSSCDRWIRLLGLPITQAFDPAAIQGRLEPERPRRGPIARSSMPLPDRQLELLRQIGTAPLSAKQLATKLNCSEASIRKLVRQIRRAGRQIDHRAGAGYFIHQPHVD